MGGKGGQQNPTKKGLGIKALVIADRGTNRKGVENRALLDTHLRQKEENI